VAYWLEELARTVRTFKFAGTSTLPMRRMDGEIASYLTYRAKHFRVLVQQGVSILVFKTLLTGGLLILGSMLVIDNRISLGQFVASEIVIVLVLGALEKVILSLETVYDILTAVDKAGHVGDLPVEDDGGQAPLAPASGAGMTVLLRQAGYRYPGAPAPALSGLSLDLAAGSRVAVTGFDGAGQTTLLKLLGGLYESHEGAVAHDGVSLHDIDRRLLRARIGLVLETNELFDGTIEENISVGRPEVGTERVLRALAQVGLQEYLLALPRGLGTPIRARGLELPQTVGRKLQLARAIAGDPALLLVDDVVQHFDIASRRQVVRALTDPAAPWTLVTATHDPMLLAAMDRVLVLDQGRLHRDGTYLEVLRDPYVQGIILPAAELAGSAA
jgi:ABC-type bacteriocin/lantibiotic exporter with double-glycine peptidase domain